MLQRYIVMARSSRLAPPAAGLLRRWTCAPSARRAPAADVLLDVHGAEAGGLRQPELTIVSGHEPRTQGGVGGGDVQQIEAACQVRGRVPLARARLNRRRSSSFAAAVDDGVDPAGGDDPGAEHRARTSVEIRPGGASSAGPDGGQSGHRSPASSDLERSPRSTRAMTRFRFCWSSRTDTLESRMSDILSCMPGPGKRGATPRATDSRLLSSPLTPSRTSPA